MNKSKITTSFGLSAFKIKCQEYGLMIYNPFMGFFNIDMNNPSDRAFAEKVKLSDGRTLAQELLSPKQKTKFKAENVPEEEQLRGSQQSESTSREHYRNNRFEAQGIKWQSEHEYKTWLWLKTLERDGVIKDLERQVKLDITVNGVLICHAILDFKYTVQETGHIVHADAKSPFTVTRLKWRWQKRLIKAVHNIDVVEIISGKPYIYVQ